MQIGCNEGIIVECNIQLQNIGISYFLIETKSHFKLQEVRTDYNISIQINLVYTLKLQKQHSKMLKSINIKNYKNVNGFVFNPLCIVFNT